MHSIHRILTPIDGSRHALAALEMAAALARQHAVPIEVLHCVRFEPTPGITLGKSRPATRIELAARDEGLAKIAHAVKMVPALDGLRVEYTVLLDPDPASAIVRAVGVGTVVVMGTHGRTGLSRLRFGSVAEHVVHHAPCTVITVHAEPALAESEK